MSRVPTALQQAKATLRMELKQKLAAMPEQERKAQSESIAEKVEFYNISVVSVLNQQNRALEAATVTLHCFTV